MRVKSLYQNCKYGIFSGIINYSHYHGTEIAIRTPNYRISFYFYLRSKEIMRLKKWPPSKRIIAQIIFSNGTDKHYKTIGWCP